MRAWLILGWLLAAILGAAGPGRAQDAGAPAARPQSAAAAAALVLPGDEISLRIWNEPEMSDTFRVNEAGVVVLPKLGAVRVAQQSIAALQDSLRIAYAEFLRNPSVEVVVLRRIGVSGEVQNPDLYLVDLTMTLRDVIARAGGVTERGNPDRIVVVRDGEQIPVNRDEYASYMTMELQSGDLVMVGSKSWFELNSLAVASTTAVVFSVVVPVLRSIF